MRALVIATILAPLAFAGGADEALLRAEGIEPTASEIGAFLRRLVPTDRQLTSALELARQLGGSAFERENATRKLDLVPAAAISALKEAVRSADPEVRRRARPLLDRVVEMIPSSQLLAALRVIAAQPVPGLAREVVGVLPLCFDRYGVDCAERALRATAGPEDRAFLSEALDAASADTRATALLGLAALGDPEDDGRLRAHLADKSSLVRIVAARALADRGDPACFPELVVLLEAGEPSVRTRAADALRHAHGQSFDYDAFDPPAARAAAARRWRAWIDARPAQAAWQRPLPRAPVRHGRTLIALLDGKRVIELDPAGTIVWQRSFSTKPWVVVGLPSGERLVAFYSTPNGVARYDREGREVWRREGLPGSPTSLQPLPGGGILVACGFQNVVLELRWDGKTAWERELHGKPTDMRQLANGRRLVALGDRGRVVEIDAEGRVHWSLKGLNKPYSARRLANGNTLVCELGAGRVSEWTRAGELGWEYGGLTWFYRAQRLPGGRTLIAERNGVIEVTPQGTKRTLYRTENEYVWVHRY